MPHALVAVPARVARLNIAEISVRVVRLCRPHCFAPFLRVITPKYSVGAAFKAASSGRHD
jgi:hypothetical protein